MLRKSLILVTFLLGNTLPALVIAGPAEDEVQHAQLWREMKNDEVSALAEKLSDANDDLEKAQKRLKEAQKTVDEATAARDVQLKKHQEAQKQLQAADSRLDKAWSVLEQERKAAGK